MMKIFNALQTREIDNCTIINQGIESIDLMERASLAVYELLINRLDPRLPVYIFAGSGNNGGDALAIARMLLLNHYHLLVFLVNTEDKLSVDCRINKKRLEHLLPVYEISQKEDIPSIPSDCTIIDGLFGSGLNRPLEGIYHKIVHAINESGNKVYSIDMPSGLFIEDNGGDDNNAIIKAEEVFTFQSPKLSLLLPDSNSFLQKMTIVDIGLCQKCMDEQPTDYNFLQGEDIINLISPRSLFSHKGDFGRALIIAGSYGKMGAAVLAAKACLRAGVGLLTMHIPSCGAEIVQTAVPEAMVDVDNVREQNSKLNISDSDIEKFTIGIGPGIGTNSSVRELLSYLLDKYRKPLVIDADALNLIAEDDSLKEAIPQKSILTPHPIEFERLVGEKFNNAYKRLQAARKFAATHDVYIVLKGAYTAIVTPEKKVYFNSTGNPGMATGGSGDILTGIITSLLAQKYTPLDASLAGVYLHGLAADLVTKSISERSLLPSDIVEYIGHAYLKLEK